MGNSDSPLGGAETEGARPAFDLTQNFCSLPDLAFRVGAPVPDNGRKKEREVKK
jgi:hypothetical protein